jgi:hypothetical protein
MNVITSDWSSVERYNDAILGSRKLRDAVLFAKGIVPPDEPPPAVIILPTKPAKPPKPKKMVPRELVHRPECCPHCGAPKEPNKLLITHIQAAVAAYYGIDIAAMRSSRRAREIAYPRQVAMYLAKELTPKSFPEIGRRFSKDHTTVMYAVKAVGKRIEDDPETALDVAALREALAG